MRSSSSVERPEAATGAVPSADGDPATATSRRRVHLLAALLAALSFMFVQLALAQNGSAAAGVPCPRTGIETVSTDRSNYTGGDTTHVTGTGYAHDCDVVVRITRPDAVVENATVTTDPISGTFSYDYLIPGPPSITGDFSVDVFGYGDALLASTVFADALTIKADLTPSYVPGANTITFRTLVRNTSTDTTISQININLPSTYTAISVAGSAFSSGTWTSVAPATGFDLSLALSSGTPLATTTGWARIDVTATTPTSASTDWQFQACANVGCTGNAQTRDQDNQAMVLVNATPPGDRYTSDFRTGAGAGDGTTTPALRNGNPTTLFLRITSSAGGNNSTKYTSVALPTCFGTPTGVSLTGGTGYTVTTRDGFIILAGGNLGNVGNFMTVQFTATPTGCANGTTTFLSSVSSNQTDDANGSNAVVAISGNYASVTMDSTKPTVTINQAAGQNDPTNSSPINFTAVFSEPVTGFTGSDVSLSGTAGATNAVVTGSGTTYNVAVSGMTSDGTVIASIPAGSNSPSTSGVQDAAGNGNTASTSTDNTVTYDTTKPNVTINQASGQSDPTNVSPINFTVVFSESVTGFASADVTIAGTAGGTKTVTVTEVAPNDGTTYDVAVSGMTQRGTVVASIPAGSNSPSTSGAQDAAGNGNSASTSTDNTVTWDRAPVATTPSFNPASPKTNDLLQASTTTSDPDADNVAVAWTWKVTRGANTCTIKTESSVSGPAGLRTVSLDLSQSYPTSACTGASPPSSINPSKGDVVFASATPNDGLLDGLKQSNTVTIVNSAPTVTLSAANDLTVNEGSAHTYSHTISDPDGDTIAAVSTSCGLHGTKSNASNTNTTGQFDCTFPDGPDGSTVTAQATDSGFGAIAGNTAFQPVTINNVAPTVAFTSAPASANEGQTKTYTYSISDPGVDTVQSVATSCGGNGMKSNTSNTNTSGTFDCTFPDGDASSTVTVQATDSDGDAGNTATQPVTINNIAPTIGISGVASLNEGSSYSLALGTVTDPGQDAVSTYVVHWGDGSSDSYGSNGVKSHTYADGPSNHAITVDVTDEDGTFLDRANPLSVHVDNVDPVVSLSGATSTNEGTTETYSYTFTDPGADAWTHDTSCGAHGSKWDDTFSQATKSGSFKCTWPDNYSGEIVLAKVTDDDAGFGTDSKSVDIANVRPTVTLTGVTSANEGDTKHYAYSWTDPGSADTVPNHSIDCGIHGHSSNALFDGATNTGSFDCTWSDDSGAGTADVTASVTDDDGDTGSDTKHVTVANVAPTAHVGGQANVDEGSTHTYAFTVSDPGTDDTFTVDSGYPDCGSGAQYVTGSLATDATGGTFDCFFPDGPASTDVKIKVTDDDGGSDSASQSVQVVQVANVAPDVTVAADQGSNEGSSHSFDLGSFTDPGDDSPWNVSVDWGDGSPTTDFTTSTTGTIPAQSHTYADGPNNYMVTVNVNDGTDTTSKTFSVHVNNVAPTIAISGNASVDEGSSYTLTLGAVTDPGTDTVSNYVVHWGDGSTDIYGTDGAKTHTYADGPSDHAIKVDLADEDGTFTDAANALSVHVNNVAPTVTLDPTNTLTWNESTSAERTFAYSTSDPAGANDPLTITIDCGTGGQYVAGSDTGTSFKCIFADGPASPTVSVSADDGDGGVGSDTQDVTVKNVDPTVTLGATNTYTFDESGTAERSFDYSVSDPAGANDPITIDSTSCGAAPNSVASNSFNASTNQGTLKCKFPDGPDTPSISIDVGDGDGGTGSASHGVTINNVAPTAHLTGAANVEEGSTHTYTFTVTDPGQDDFSVNGGYPDCGTGGEYVDGTLSTNAGGGSFDCFFPDGPANTDVKIKVTDEDGGSDSASESVQVVQVANVAPDVAAATDQSSNEGQNHSFDLGSFTDPGDDSPWTVTVDWGDGSFPYTTFYAATAGTIPAQSHTYGDGPNDYTVTVSVNDGEATTSKTFAVHVNNVAPTVAFTAAPDSANEGQTKHYTYSISDPGVDTVESVATSCGANGTTSNATNTNTSGSFDCTFPDGDASSTVTVQATDSDHDAGNTASQPVTISNVAPTIAISGDSSENEGSSYTLNLGAVTDPGQDTVTQWIVHWGDGQSDTYASDGNVTHTYVDGPGDHTIKVDLTDEDGTFTDAANALSVHVNNVAPTIAVSGNANVDEGSTYTLTLGAVSDPGTDTVSSYLVHWGDGSSNAYSTGGAKTHTYADGPNNYDITVDLTDEDGSFTDAANAFSVHVNNVAPTISISGAANVNEGSSYSLTVGAVSDPGTDTVSSYVVHWGDGSTDTYPTNGVKTHIYADGPNSYKITGDLTDEDGTFTDAANALSVHVNNVAPTAHLAGAANVEEGSTHTYTFTVTDPGQDAYTVDQPDYPTCGSGGHYVTGSLTTNAGGGSFDCFFPDGPASSDVKIKVTDEDGGSDSASESVQVVDVANIPPNVTAPADQSSNEGQNHSFDLGSFTDPGDDSPWTVSVDWGDGSFPLTSFQVTSTGTIPATSHTYSDNGMYTVTVSVNDGEATPSTTFKVTVHNVAPTVHLSGPASTTEGTTESYSYTFTDPGADTWTHTTSCGAHGSLSDDSFDQATKSGSFKCTWADNYLVESVSATVTDDDTGSGSDSKLVDIANVKPMVTLSGLPSANEGDTKSYTYSWTDPGSADTFPSHFVGCGSHGTASSEVFDGIAKTGSFDCTWSDDSGAATSEVTVSVSDDDSGTGGATKHVTVANLAPSTPSLTAPADNSTTTDNTPTFDWSDSTDPAGANDTITYRILVDDNCDFSSPERDVTTGSSGFTPVTALADGTYCWKVSASDDDGGASSDSSVFHLTIDATVPTVVSITRVDASPTNASTVHWTVIFSESVTGVDSSDFALANGGLGGSPAVSGVSGSGTTYTVTASTGTGSGTLGLNLVDNDSIGDGAGNPLGGTGASNGSLTGEVYTIDRSALTVTINQAVGQLDPTSTAPIKFAVVFNKPVTDFNNADVDLSSSTAGGTLIANVYNSGDNKTYEVKVNGMTTAGGVVINVGANKATDAAGNGNQTATIIDNKVTWNPAIGNNTPTAYIDSPPFGSTYAKGTASITLKAHFTDPDNGPWTYTINWDDSTGNSTGSLTTSGQNFQANHSFPNTGVYTINVCVKDSAGASGCAQVWIVVYDPNGGFVTGGGWINVGAGSYAADPTLTGRANFGFNSQYKKNANVPTGETEFNFQVGNFNFHSEAYTWLVVSGYKAQYKGTGSVNGVSGYDFTLTAYDGDITGGGGADMFRIRITKTNNGNVVFDNRNGKPTDMDTADPQVIAGGSIVIHKA